jgi:predicted pyridoxine 5'-phosphate oxidase superfamily flavin-nucleotide-binding protein
MTMTTNPWHAGERAMQERLGMVGRMAQVGPLLIRDFMPDQHREFFSQLPFLLIGSVDEQDDAWASVLAGAPGFVRSPDPRTLVISLEAVRIPGLEPGRSIGLLGIEPHTRRRNRMNGTITSATAGELTIAVQQSFGNCPKYIHPRELVVAPNSTPQPIERFDGLDASARAQITAADTLFVASYTNTGTRQQVDISHRGGPPGFVQIDADGLLTIPDYAGNRFFNTLGNISVQPRVGLLFIDFIRGDLLQIVGTAQVSADGDPRLAAFPGPPGVERAWFVRPLHAVRRPAAFPLRWLVHG